MIGNDTAEEQGEVHPVSSEPSASATGPLPAEDPSSNPPPAERPSDPPDSVPASPHSAAELRDVSDPRTIRALAHPIRLQLLEVLGLEGPLTATQAGELIGETPTTCSFHLRQLQKYGFVEDSGRKGTRERPWRLVNRGINVPDWTGEPEVDIAAGTLTKVFLERAFARMRQWWEQRASYPPSWLSATGINQAVWFVTSEELAELMAELEPLLFRYVDRLDDPERRPAGAMPVEVLIFSYLMRMPGKD